MGTELKPSREKACVSMDLFQRHTSFLTNICSIHAYDVGLRFTLSKRVQVLGVCSRKLFSAR